MTPGDKAGRARDAQSLLDNRLFQEAWESGHRHYLDQIEAERDRAKRDKIWQALQVFKVVRAHFEALVRDGEAAEKIHAAHDKKLQAAGREGFSMRRAPMEMIRQTFGGFNGTR